MSRRGRIAIGLVTGACAAALAGACTLGPVRMPATPSPPPASAPPGCTVLAGEDAYDVVWAPGHQLLVESVVRGFGADAGLDRIRVLDPATGRLTDVNATRDFVVGPTGGPNGQVAWFQQQIQPVYKQGQVLVGVPDATPEAWATADQVVGLYWTESGLDYVLARGTTTTSLMRAEPGGSSRELLSTALGQSIFYVSYDGLMILADPAAGGGLDVRAGPVGADPPLVGHAEPYWLLDGLTPSRDGIVWSAYDIDHNFGGLAVLPMAGGPPRRAPVPPGTTDPESVAVDTDGSLAWSQMDGLDSTVCVQFGAIPSR